MNTEKRDHESVAGWVLYDADCDLCTTWARRSKKLLARRQFVLLPLQTPWVRARLGVPEAQLLTEMRLLRPNGEVFGGANALLEIGRQFWWSWPLAQMGRLPGIHALVVAAYRWVAGHRSCAAGACDAKEKASRRH